MQRILSFLIPTQSTMTAVAGVLTVILFASCRLSGATLVAGSGSVCDQTTVANAISSASSGDTVSVSPNSTCSTTWSGLAIPNTKGITLTGNGNVTITGSMTVDPNASTAYRITGFTFLSGGAITNCPNGLTAACLSTGTPVSRIDHNIFTNSADSLTFIQLWGVAPVLVDHNSFSSGPASEQIHNSGYGTTTGDMGWRKSIAPGSPYMMYFENNTFTNTTPSGSPVSAIQNYFSAGVVWRYNTMNQNCSFDAHGNTPPKTRWWEVYQNTYTVNGGTQVGAAYLRGGSGVFYNNHLPGTVGSGIPGIQLQEENSSNYPACYQVGRGYDPSSGSQCSNSGTTPNTPNSQLSSPAYFWGNDAALQSTIVSISTNVVLNRDFFISTSQPASMLRCEQSTDVGAATSCSTTYNYTPFTYPYPLDTNGMPSPGGSTSTNLNPPTALVTNVQ